MGENSANQVQKNAFAVRMRAFSYCLNRSRFSIVVLAIGLGLLLSDQGQDLLVGVGDDGKIWQVLLAATAWAFSIWGWCRLLLDISFSEPPSCTDCYNFWRKWMPRLLGSLAFVVLAFAAFSAEQYTLMGYTIVALIGFNVFVALRRKAQRKTAEVLGRFNYNFAKATSARLDIKEIDIEKQPPYTSFVEALGVSSKGELFMPTRWKLWRTALAMLLFAAFAVLAIWGNLDPVSQGSCFGALILFFIWGATWLPVGSLMSYAADKKGLPLLTLLLLVALISSLWNDNHEIRVAGNGAPVNDRPTVTQALEAWATANKPSYDKDTPFVVVATAGGGIRAAYWTVTVLGDLHEKSAQFAERNFAISGVSGGSVGATVYRAVLEVQTQQIKESCSKDGVMKCAQHILGHDFLGANTSAMLYPDLAQRFWPFPWFPDRAKALEQAWERAFHEETGIDVLNTTIGKLGAKAGTPMLFLNATWADNGRRIVASNLRFGPESDEQESFARSNDQLAVLGRDIRLSTAAHNSARFPMVSPPGMWKQKDKIAGRLQDGGLFENYGAETALEILDLACKKFSCDGLDSEKKRIKPVVILISSDPHLLENLAESSTDYKPTHFGYEVRSTFKTYEKVRSGRAAEEASRLEAWTKKNGKGKFYHFRMCKTEGAGQPPLGWYLSESAKTTIRSYLLKTEGEKEVPECRKGNQEEEKQLIETLKR